MKRQSASTHFAVHNTALMRFPRKLFNQPTFPDDHELSSRSFTISLQIKTLELGKYILHLLTAPNNHSAYSIAYK